MIHASTLAALARVWNDSFLQAHRHICNLDLHGLAFCIAKARHEHAVLWGTDVFVFVALVLGAYAALRFARPMIGEAGGLTGEVRLTGAEMDAGSTALDDGNI